MPGYKTHLMGGIAAYFILALFIVVYLVNPSTPTLIEWFICALAGSLFPDIDIKSKGQKYFYWAILLGFAVLMYLNKFKLVAQLSLIACVPMLVNHRGMFHRLWFVIGVPFIAAVVLGTYFPLYSHKALLDAAFFSAGAISHLWLDLGFRRMLRL